MSSKTYKPDLDRGKWSSKWDFMAVNLAHSFGQLHFSLFPYIMMKYGGIYFLIPYFLGMLTYSIPEFIVQSYLGQFSSSGFISVYRIAPLFKGLGYIMLALNITAACYMSVMAAMPLLYFFESWNMPWMSCHNVWNTPNCFEEADNITADYEHDADGFAELPKLPTFEYISYVKIQDLEDFAISWKILPFTSLVWFCIGIILVGGIEKMGKIIRILFIIIFLILITMFVRFLLLDEATTAIIDLFQQPFFTVQSWLLSFIFTMVAFGVGWSTVLTMASYNHFHEDIGVYSLVINFAQMGLVIITGFSIIVVESFLKNQLNFNFNDYGTGPGKDFIYVGFAYFFGRIPLSEFWSLLFFLMLFLAELSTCVILVFITLTAIFDEFEAVRNYKKVFTVGLVGGLSLISVIFHFNRALNLIEFIISAVGSTQIFFRFTELMVVTWVYGRFKFQRDLEFILGKVWPNWQIFIIRFVTPVVLILLTINNYLQESLLTYNIIKHMPTFFLAIYAISQLMLSKGDLNSRLLKLCEPKEWHPAEPNIKFKYEEHTGIILQPI